MKTLIKPQAKLEISSFDNPNNQFEEKLFNSRIDAGFKFYQKLLVILLTFCTFLIFPESPQDSEILCKKFHSEKACIIW